MALERPKYLRDLRRKIVIHFNMEDLEILTFDLGVNWDELPGEQISKKANSLIMELARNGRLSDLLALLDEERPNVDWPDKLPPLAEQIEDAKRASLTENELEKVLQTFIAEIRNLLLDYDLRHSEAADARQIARTQTILTIRQLDSERNQRLIGFLRELRLIGGQPDILDFSKLELRGCELSGVDLSYVDLNWSDFRGSLLIETRLEGANLYKTLMSGANLERADLRKANLNESFLTDCNLRFAILHEASLIEADLYKSDLCYVHLLGAQLKRANLIGVDLRHALISKPDLKASEISLLKIHGVSLSKADFTGARYDSSTKWPDGFDPDDEGLLYDG